MITTAQIFTTASNAPATHSTIRSSSILICLCAILFFTMLDGFARFGRLPALIWLLAYTTVFATFVLRPAQTLDLVIRNWPVFIIPCLAILSIVWSSAPMRTPLAAIQLFVTVLIAVHVFAAMNTRQVMLALFLGQAAGIIASGLNLGIGFMPSINPVNGTLIGIYGHKTALGYSAILSSFALTAYFAYGRREIWAIPYVILVYPIVIMSDSKTAFAGYGALIALWFFLIIRRCGPLAARRLMLFIFLFLVGMVTASLFYFDAVSSTFLSIAGKSENLTGRTELWDIAMTTAKDRPLLGTGFGAFWHSPEHALDVAYVHAYVDDRVDGFHNAFLESIVALGGVGLVVLMAMVAIPLVRLAGRCFLNLSLDAMIWLPLLTTYILMAMLFQDVGFKQHSGNYILMTLCYLYANARACSQN